MLEADVELDRREFRQVPPWQRRVGLLRQDPALFRLLSVRQNLAYPAPAKHGSGGTGRAEIARIAERLGIGGLLDDRPARLPGPAGDGPDFAFTVLDPPCFGPDGLRVSHPEEVST